MNTTFLQELQSILGKGGVISGPDELMVYECDAYVAAKQRPQAVAFPRVLSKSPMW
jgi:hypothetical protein